jgi:1,4-dihydroxy-6-naphthoate synthase
VDRIEIRVAHSPDSDDAFMFYALAAGRIPTGAFRFTHRLEDIETLNQKALRGEYEVTAVSIHAYAYIADKYALLPSGASMGDRYGPILVTREPWKTSDLHGKRIAVPGTMTSAFLALKLFQPEFNHVVISFDQIMAAVQHGEVDAGLLIHEGQLTYSQEGLHKVVDLGEWWYERTGLPLPLGGNAIRRDLGMEKIQEISRLLRQSIQYALEHREDALNHALQYARGLDRSHADRFVGMYVNSRTVDYGPDGRRAVQLFLDQAHQQHLIPSAVRVEFVD